MKKRVLAAVLGLILALSCIPFSVAATTELPDMSNSLIEFNQEMPELVITESTPATENSGGTVNPDGFIEVLNTTDRVIDLANYKIVLDPSAQATGSKLVTVPMATAKTELQPGQVGVIFLADKDTDTVDSCKSVYMNVSNATRRAAYFGDAVCTLMSVADATAITKGLLGSNQASYYWGIVPATVTPTEDRVNWTSWIRFDYYYTMGAEGAYPSYVDDSNKGTFVSIPSNRNGGNNVFYNWTFNGDGNTSMNFGYGMNGASDIREGRQITAVCKERNPGVLMNWQRAQFTAGNPNLVISAVMPSGPSGNTFEYVTITNVSGTAQNVYDYAFVGNWIDGRYDAPEDAFLQSYFNRWNYIIPAENGNILDYDHSLAAYSDAVISNSARADGELQPGESAIIWFYNAAARTGNKTFNDFRTAYGNVADTTKIFAVNSDNTGAVAAKGYRVDLSDTGKMVYGLAKLENLNLETGAPEGETAEIVAEQIIYENKYHENLTKYTDYNKTGINVSDVDSFVFADYTAVSGLAGTATASNGQNRGGLAKLNEQRLYTSLSNVAVLYFYAGVKGNRVGGYLQMVEQSKVGSSKINTYYTTDGKDATIYSAKAKSKQNFWTGTFSTPNLDDWTVAKVAPGALADGQFPGTYEIPTVKYTIEAVGYQNHLTDPDTLRIAVVFDSLDYAQVGVDVHMQYVSDQYVIAHPDATFNVWTAYEALSGMDGDTKMTYAASDFGGTYIGAIVLKDLGQDPGLFPATPVVITVKPWTLTEGGVKEYGAEKSFTYEIPLS